MNADSSIRRYYKVAVVDDHPIVRQGLCQAVAREADLQVCAEASGIVEALQKIEGTCPDVLVIDLSLDGENGIDLIDYAKSRAPALKILVYSAHDEETFAGRVLRAGGLGFINKREPISKVVEAIRQVLRGEVYLSPQMTKSLLHRAALGKTLDSEPLSTLSDRELQVFQLIGEGLSTVQIAHKLELSPKTVESHRKTIKQKLNIQTSAQLSRRAFQWVMEKQ
jgi:DNA-binding NarL/FixJ family response regulator